jgi:Cu(I)/Ag(I) efflux system protein CusF
MKKSLITSVAAILLLSATAAMAQQKSMDGMKNMPMDKMMDGMKNMPMGQPAVGQSVHMARGKVTKVDAGANVVTLAHEPVKSLNWPAMAMGFQVKDKMLLDKLTVGKTVDFEFVQAEKAYVITGVK